LMTIFTDLRCQRYRAQEGLRPQSPNQIISCGT
jgi:hypothetical protein